jgi:hypothetical protein
VLEYCSKVACSWKNRFGSKRKSVFSNAFAQKDDKFLVPFLINDSLLYNCDDEGEDDDVVEFDAIEMM